MVGHQGGCILIVIRIKYLNLIVSFCDIYFIRNCIAKGLIKIGGGIFVFVVLHYIHTNSAKNYKIIKLRTE